MFKNREEYLKMRNALLTEAEQKLTAGDVEGFNAKETEVKELDAKFENWTKMQANLNAMKQNGNVIVGFADQGAGATNFLSPERITDVIVNDDPFNTLGYRQSFMNFAKTGVMDMNLQNTNAQTTTTDASAVIPTTIMKEIIKEMKVYGQIFNRVRKLNVKGGVDFPILTLKPVASWITEAAPSERKKVEAKTKVSFSYYGLECKVAISLLADTTSLEGFESTITELIVEAMVQAMDVAIIKGDGNGQPMGVVNDTRVPAGNKITMAAEEFSSYAGWKGKVFAKIPLAHRAGGSFIMAAGTFEGKIDGMVDANGQPIARTNHGIVDGPQERFGGREVILVEDDVIAPYDSAAVGDVVAVFCNLKNYAINSNMQMMMFRWFDHDTNQYVDKAVLICDGKILDPNGVILIKKG